MNDNIGKKILIADDDLSFLDTADKKLTQRGFQVLVSNLSEAVNILKREVISTVFIDYNSAKSDGASILNTVESLEDKPLIQYFGQLAEMEGPEKVYQ